MDFGSEIGKTSDGGEIDSIRKLKWRRYEALFCCNLVMFALE